MKLADINPHIRYCYRIFYQQGKGEVFVKDCRLMCPLSGTGTITIENKQYTLNKGTLFYCNSGSTYTLSSENGFSLVCINFDLDRKFSQITAPLSPVPVNAAEKKEPVNPCTVEDSDFLGSHIYLTDTAEFSKTFIKLAEEFNSQKKFHYEKCSSLLKCILTDMHRIETASVSSADAIVNKIISHIGNNLSSAVDNKTLASIAGYHPYHLNRLFIKCTGTSMHKYILRMRLNEAKQLLLSTDSSLNVICSLVGFNNYTHFSNYFKKEFSLSPSEFRKKFKNSI